MLALLLLMMLGLVLLVGGAHLLIRGVSAIAQALGIPRLVIGLTVVAFGTSTPELVLNVIAAARGETALAFGSIIGSCTVNIGWVLALTALIKPVKVEKSIVTRELPMMLLGTTAVVLLASDHAVSGDRISHLNRGDGLMLLLLFGVFLYYTVRNVLVLWRNEPRKDPFVDELAESIERKKLRPMWIHFLMTAAGLIGVAFGGRLSVIGAVGVAKSIGLSEAIVGLTIVSFGTTLPELVTGLVAVQRGESDLAIGNVVGSNIFNILFIGGIVATIHPVPVPPGGASDLLYLLALSIVLIPIAIRGPRMITRAEGALLLTTYLTYTTWRTIHSGAAR